MMKKICILVLAVSFILVLAGCGAQSDNTGEQKSDNTQKIEYRFASKEEAAELLLGNKEYYDGFSQNDLDYKFQKKNAKMDDYLAFSGEQTLDYSDEEKKMIDECVASMEKTLKDNGYAIPEIDEIVFIKTTMREEGSSSSGYPNPEIIDGIMENLKGRL